jgi:hypothetical protein
LGQQQPLPAATSIHTRTSTRAGRRAVLQAGTEAHEQRCHPHHSRDQCSSTTRASAVQQAIQTCTARTAAAVQAASKVQGRNMPDPGLCQGSEARRPTASQQHSKLHQTKRKARAERLRRQTMCLPGKAALPCPDRDIHLTRCQLPMVVHTTLTLSCNGGCVVGACIVAAAALRSVHLRCSSAGCAAHGPVVPACLLQQGSCSSCSTARRSVALALGTPALVAHNAARLPDQ